MRLPSSPIKRAWILHFSIRLILSGFVLLICTLAVVWWVWTKWAEIDMARDFARSGLPMLAQTAHWEDGNLQFDEELLEKVHEVDGWLQVIDEQGRVTYSVFVPDEVPNSYTPGELVSYWIGQQPFAYDLYLWIDGHKDLTLLFGVPGDRESLVREVQETAVFTNGRLTVPETLEEQLIAENTWIQLLDRDGRVLATLEPENPDGAVDDDAGSPSGSTAFPYVYSPQELALRAIYSERYGTQLTFVYDEKKEWTWVAHQPSSTTEGFLQTETEVMMAGFLTVIAVTLLLFLLMAFWFGHRFGTPVLHMIAWTERLSRGDFRDSAPRKHHRLFARVYQALQHLTEQLQKNEKIRKKMEASREEWLTGITHDLKTPLASVKGYAHMLEAPEYDWSREEIREFSSFILEKATHMEALIEDLNLVYRLQNDALPLNVSATDVKALVTDIVRTFRQHPRFAQADLELERDRIPEQYRLDGHLFQRAVDNVLANAFVHNPPGTRVLVSAEQRDDGGWQLNVKDNGKGMDEATVSKLFERYYRGTQTEDGPDGTGLGLSIARQILLAHGGDIQVDSSPEQGTTVALIFP